MGIGATMKFYEEDGIITAKQAIKRSQEGKEDSIVRESIRTVMSYVKRTSQYGYWETRIFNQPAISDEIKDILADMGYKFRIEPYYSSRPDWVRWDWIISWGPKAYGDRWPINKE
jgi:hypothetical protein